jgi:septal ring factor EnvC (AmiA/AmiB activator)
MAPTRPGRVLRFVGVIAVASMLLPQAGAVGQGRSSDVPTTLKELKAALADANASEAKLTKAVAQANAARNQAERDLKAAGDERIAAHLRSVYAQKAVNNAAGRVRRLQAILGDRARGIYIAGSPADIRALIQSGDPEALLDQAALLDHLAQQGNNSLADLLVAQRDFAKARVVLLKAEQDARRAEAAMRVKINQATQLRDVRLLALNKLTSKITLLRGRVAALQLNQRIGNAEQAGVVRRGNTRCNLSGTSNAEYNIIMKESGGNPYADNPTSTAFGLGQLLYSGRATYLGAANADTVDCGLQLQAFRSYVRDRYGTAEAAWAFWQSHHWY